MVGTTLVSWYGSKVFRGIKKCDEIKYFYLTPSSNAVSNNDCVHSQKELAHWGVDVTVEFYACLFNGSLMCNL